ncbi:MAG: hypothetical protein IKN24_01185 [Lachnospiraceae bacterium]|nr:hypothetical protein [Lachnospiraceae bacterium]
MNYDDIIDMKWPAYRNHHPMDRGNRAKIFAPFQALTGFGEKIKGAEKAGEADESIEYVNEEYSMEEYMESSYENYNGT